MYRHKDLVVIDWVVREKIARLHVIVSHELLVIIARSLKLHRHRPSRGHEVATIAQLLSDVR